MHFCLLIVSTFAFTFTYFSERGFSSPPAAAISKRSCDHYYDSALRLTIYTTPTTQTEFPDGAKAILKQTSISVSRKEVGFSDDKVILILYINEEGKMVAAKAPDREVNNHSELEKKVIEKLKSVKWKAATCDNQMVASTYLFVVQFCFSD